MGGLVGRLVGRWFGGLVGRLLVGRLVVGRLLGWWMDWWMGGCNSLYCPATPSVGLQVQSLILKDCTDIKVLIDLHLIFDKGCF